MNKGPFDNDGHNAAGYDESGEYDENKRTDYEPEDSDYEGGEPDDTYEAPAPEEYVAPHFPDGDVPYDPDMC